jgi:hypothetical protein
MEKHNNLYLAAVAILNFPSTKIHRNFEENHPRNIPTKFDSKWPSGFSLEWSFNTGLTACTSK